MSWDRSPSYCSDGKEACLEALIPLVEDELRRIAHAQMRRERSGHTLQTTALINEAYLRLVDRSRTNWQNRTHSLGVASGLMRRILLDHARGLCRGKRRGASRLDARKAQVVELRYFGGLSVEEAAEVLQVHPNTIIRDWTLAKAWLKRELSHGAGGGDGA